MCNNFNLICLIHLIHLSDITIQIRILDIMLIILSELSFQSVSESGYQGLILKLGFDSVRTMLPLNIITTSLYLLFSSVILRYH